MLPTKWDVLRAAHLLQREDRDAGGMHRHEVMVSRAVPAESVIIIGEGCPFHKSKPMQVLADAFHVTIKLR